VNAVVNFLSGNRDGKRGLLVAVNNGWNFSFAANCTGGPLTDPFARLGLKRRALAHGIFLSVAGVSPVCIQPSIMHNPETAKPPLTAWPSGNFHPRCLQGCL